MAAKAARSSGTAREHHGSRARSLVQTARATVTSPTQEPASSSDRVDGRFGRFGGRYVPETLVPALDELTNAHASACEDPAFNAHLRELLSQCVGRPTPLMPASNLSHQLRIAHGASPDIYFKREDLCHTGAHKINNALGQALLARRMGKRRVVAETGAGQHGLATSTACALLGLKCVVYMGAEDIHRQAPNVSNMRLRGAQVVPVHQGSATLKDATSEAIRDWVTNVYDSHYVLGSAAGPHPYPSLVRDFHSCIGEEVRSQALEEWGGKPDCLLACVGGGSNAIGLFNEFIDDSSVRLVGVEAAGKGIDRGIGSHAATLGSGTPGVLHGSLSMMLQDADGQIIEPYSISAGLDYPGVGPEHAHLQESGRCTYYSATDDEAMKAFEWVSRSEGVMPAMETAHSLALLPQLARDLPDHSKLVVNLSGSGKKDIGIFRNRYED